MRGSQYSGTIGRWMLVGFGVVLAAACGDTTGPEPVRLEAVTSTELTASVGQVVEPTPTVRVTDERGTPLSGVPVFFTVGENGGSAQLAIVPTRSDGLASVGAWALGRSIGTFTLTARVGAQRVSFHALATAGGVGEIWLSAGDRQVGAAGETLPVALRVWVNDGDGTWNPVAGEPVTFTVVSGGGVLENESAVTDSSGSATAGLWMLGPEIGTQRVSVKAGPEEVFFEATAVDAVTFWDSTLPSCGSDPACGTIVFVSDRGGDQDLYSVRPDGTDLVRLTNDPASDRDPSWSPDGMRIAFVSDRDGTSDIYVMNEDGSNVVRRTISARSPGSPSWSPDGTRIAYSAVSDGSLDIWVVDADAGGPGPELLFGGTGWDAFPAWSPDGQLLALSSDRNAYDFVQDVFVYDMDVTLTAVTGDIFDGIDYVYPSWSPDGARLSVTSNQTVGIDRYRGHVGVIDLDDGELRVLRPSDPWSPSSWSPGGDLIAFTSDGSILWVTSDGAASGLVIEGGWSPDWGGSAP